MIAIVVPNEEYLLDWIKQNGLSLTKDTMRSNDAVLQAIMNDIIEIGAYVPITHFLHNQELLSKYFHMKFQEQYIWHILDLQLKEENSLQVIN